MLCIARTMLSLNVCLSVTRQFCVKTVKHITSPSVSNIILVLCTVSYSPSIVTVAVSVAILEIFSVKDWPDLEIWVWGPSSSLRMARFDRPCMSFY